MSGARGADPGPRRTGLLRAEYVLPVVIVLAALLLGISEFSTTFEFTPPGAEPLREQAASDRHSYALLLLAICTVGAMLGAILTGVRAAAVATAVFGVAALLLFLVLDLPDAGKLGDLEDPTRGLASARAEPQTGFWVQAISGVVLGLTSVAFATLSSEQLQAPLRRLRGRRRRSDSTNPEPKPEAKKRERQSA